MGRGALKQRSRSLRRLTLLAGLAGAVVFRLAAQQSDNRPGIAVLPFENGGSYGQDRENYEALRRGIAGLLISHLAQNPQIRLVERSESQRLLEEQSLGAAGRVDRETAARVGRLVGARYMIAGTFIDLYGEFRVYARIIDVETGEILQVARPDSKLRNLKDLDRMTQTLATSIITETKLPALPPTTRLASREIPPAAFTLYSRALLYEDRGDKAKAIEYYQKAIQAFPDFIEAKEGLKKAQGSGT
jgi:TolB-like protein